MLRLRIGSRSGETGIGAGTHLLKWPCFTGPIRRFARGLLHGTRLGRVLICAAMMRIPREICKFNAVRHAEAVRCNGRKTAGGVRLLIRPRSRARCPARISLREERKTCKRENSPNQDRSEHKGLSLVGS